MYIDKVEDGVDRCYVPIMRQQLEDESQNWIMGQIFFKNHYTVFDMTHADDTTTSNSDQYHLIGINFKRTIFPAKEIIEDDSIIEVDPKAKWYEPLE